MTVLTAIVVYPRREAPHAQIPAASDAAPPVPSRPTFLDQPARNPAARFDSGAAGGPSRRGEMTAPPSAGDGFATSAAWEPRRDQSPREKAYAAALTSPAVATESAGGVEPGVTAASVGAGDPPLAAQGNAEAVTLGDSIMRAAGRLRRRCLRDDGIRSTASRGVPRHGGRGARDDNNAGR